MKRTQLSKLQHSYGVSAPLSRVLSILIWGDVNGER